MNIRKLFAMFSFRNHLDKRDKIIPTGKTTPQLADTNLSYDGLQLTRPLVIVDVGCRWGFAEKFTKKGGGFRIYGFDPDEEECKKLNLLYGSSMITLVPFALAGLPGKRTLYVTREPACSSLLEPDPVLTERYPALFCAKHVKSMKVEVTTLDVWASTAHIEAVDYMKIDTQGTELDILKGGIKLLKNVRCLEVEVEFNPIYLGQALFSDVDIFLRDNDFVLWKLTNQVHYSNNGSSNGPIGEDSVFYDDACQIRHEIHGGQLYWANACYVRKEVLQAQTASSHQAFRDAALFNALGMPDVVQHVLDSQNSMSKQ